MGRKLVGDERSAAGSFSNGMMLALRHDAGITPYRQEKLSNAVSAVSAAGVACLMK